MPMRGTLLSPGLGQGIGLGGKDVRMSILEVGLVQLNILSFSNLKCDLPLPNLSNL